MVPARQITPRTDYAAVMKEALKPINDTANTVQQVLKINHARTVKAESDDAENMVIQTINTYMNDPENGYMTKQGKNAMDGFQPTVEKMQADIHKIVGQLQPATRQAIESRINDRMVSAIGQAQRWNTQQTQKYHIDSSKARVETLLDDAANHYADSGYLAKTWGSIEAELEYQTADFSGMPPEAAKQMKDQTFALFQSKRFAAWSQDDPVMAFAAFRNEKKNIDPDIAQKIENSLFGQSRDLLAYELAMKPLTYDGADTFEPKDFTNEYNTKLSAEEEKEFQKWAKEQGRERDLFDYDLRGAWKEMQSGSMQEDDRGHLGDKYKKPNHPTFSNQSIYSNDQNIGGKWEERDGQTVFTPGRKLSKAEADFLQRYFAEVEPGVVLNASVQDNAKTWMDDPRAKTGDAFIDSLPKEKRLVTVLKARQYRNSFVSASESEFDSSIKNQYAKLRLGQPQEQYTKDDFIRRYGPVKGEKEYSTYLSNYAQNSAYWTFGELPDQDIYSALKAFKPDPKSSDFTAEQQKNYEALVKSADEIVRERKKDPAQFAIDRGMYGFERIDVKNETQLLQGLKNRSDSLSQMKDQWDLKNPRILSADEQKELTEYISQIEPAKQLEFIRKLGAATGRDAGEVLAAQMSDKYGLALTLDLDNFAGSENSAFYYLTGSQAIEEGQSKVKDIETNKTQGRPEYIESLNGLFDDPDLRANVADTVTGVAAGILVSGKTSSMRTAFRQAEKLVIGDVYEFRGRKIFTRNGRSDANVRERIFTLRNKLKNKKENVVQLPNKQKLTGEQFARDFATAQLRNSPDDNKFYVISGSGVVYDLQGNPFVIDIGG